MHLNFYFLKQLSEKLKECLAGARFIEAFTQQKNELVICFRLKDDSIFYLRATLTSAFTCLSFPPDFKRTRKNSVNLFEELSQDHVSTVYQFDNERAFSIIFRSGLSLLFKLHGNRSNIVLFKADKVVKLFKSGLSKDLLIQPSALDRKLEFSFNNFQKNPDIRLHFPTYGKVVMSWLKEQEYDGMSLEQQWDLLIKLDSLLNQGRSFIHKIDHRPTFSLLEFRESEILNPDPIEAINAFYYQFSKIYFFESNKTKKLKVLGKKRQQLENYIHKSQEKLRTLKDGTQPKEIGDILMANLHMVKTGSTEARLHNFYTNSEITIRLNSKLSPQKNAENFYRKGKNRQIEEKQIKDSVNSKKEQLLQTDELITKIQETKTNKELMALTKNHDLVKSSTTPEIRLPYKEFQINGFRVWVGKNAKANDELTLKYSFKEDLWLHAKDVPGSHVLIKYDSSRSFDTATIERSAELAAYYSKRKTDTLAPVIYTAAKYVRKRKGSPAGMVVVEKENVIIVPPKDPTSL